MGIFSSDFDDVVTNIKKGKMDKALEIIKEKNIDINELHDGKNLLSYSVYYARDEMFDKLIEMGAKVTAPEKLLKINLPDIDEKYLTNWEIRLDVSGIEDDQKLSEFLARCQKINNKLITEYNADQLLPKPNMVDFLNSVSVNTTSSTLELILSRHELNGVNIKAVNEEKMSILDKLATSSRLLEDDLTYAIPILVKYGAAPGSKTIQQFSGSHIQYNKSVIGCAIDNDLYKLTEKLIENGIKPTPEDYIDTMQKDLKNQAEVDFAKWKVQMSNKIDKATGATAFLATGSLALGLIAGGKNNDKETQKLEDAMAQQSASSKILTIIKDKMTKSELDYVDYFCNLMEDEGKNLSFTKSVTDLLHITKDERPDVLISYEDFIKKQNLINKQDVSNKIDSVREKFTAPTATSTLSMSKP